MPEYTHLTFVLLLNPVKAEVVFSLEEGRIDKICTNPLSCPLLKFDMPEISDPLLLFTRSPLREKAHGPVGEDD